LQSHPTRHVAAILLLAATRAGAESAAPAATMRFLSLQTSVVTHPATFKKYLYRIEETSASFEARSAPRSYPTIRDIHGG
jgi:hypothetical protein